MIALHGLTILGTSILGLGWLVRAFACTAGSTLRAPLVWCVVAWSFVAVVACCEGSGMADSGDSAWRYAAGVASLCPAMALLGAKRPQDRGWQFIVVTLWIVLLIPVAQRWVFSPTVSLELHAAWRGFLTLLIVVQVANYLPTSHALAALLVGSGQVLLLSAHGPLGYFPQLATPPVTATLATFALATALVGWRTPRAVSPIFKWPEDTEQVAAPTVRTAPTALATPTTPTALALPTALTDALRESATRSHQTTIARNAEWLAWNQLWIRFRNAFGAVWALRVMERINQAGRQATPPIELTWHGFEADHSAASPSLGAELEVSMRATLRRFVSPAWIESQLAARSDE